MSINIKEEPILKYMYGGSDNDIKFLNEYATVMLSKGGGHKKIKKRIILVFFNK